MRRYRVLDRIYVKICESYVPPPLAHTLRNYEIWKYVSLLGILLDSIFFKYILNRCCMFDF